MSGQPSDKVGSITELQDQFLDASFTIGSEASNVINAAVQLKTDRNQASVASRKVVLCYLADANTGADVVGTAPDGGVATGTNGKIVSLVSGKMFYAIANASGQFDINITHAAGAKTVYLVVVCGQRQVISGAITFA
jgi:hypothetical protein